MEDRTMRIKSTLVFLMVVAIGFTSNAAEPKNIEELKALFASFEKNTGTFTADYAMTMDMAASGQPGAAGMGEMKTSGDLKVKGDKMHMDMTMKMAMGAESMDINMQMVMGDDQVMTMLVNMQGMVQAIKMDMKVMAEIAEEIGVPASALNSGNMGMGMMANPAKMLDTYEEMYELKLEGKTKLDGEDVYEITAVMNEDILENFSSNPLLAGQAGMFKDGQKLYLGANDGIMRKMDMGGIMSMTMSNVDFSTEITDADFELDIPEGTQVMDMTEMMKGMFGGQN
jgi:outer membrane lipoprotein-sorting protein